MSQFSVLEPEFYFFIPRYIYYLVHSTTRDEDCKLLRLASCVAGKCPRPFSNMESPGPFSLERQHGCD